MNDFTIRAAVPEDISFIYATWLNSYRYDGLASKGIRNCIFYPAYNKVIDGILKRPDCKVLVAHVRGEPNVVLGYMVSEPGTIHYTFCKEAFRGFGIISALFRESFGDNLIDIICTAKTRGSSDIFNTNPKLVYNPFTLFQQ